MLENGDQTDPYDILICIVFLKPRRATDGINHEQDTDDNPKIALQGQRIRNIILAFSLAVPVLYIQDIERVVYPKVNLLKVIDQEKNKAPNTEIERSQFRGNDQRSNEIEEIR